MLYLVIKAVLSAIIIVAGSEIANRSPATGALVASLLLVSVLGIIWLWHDKDDPERLAAQNLRDRAKIAFTNPSNGA